MQERTQVSFTNLKVTIAYNQELMLKENLKKFELIDDCPVRNVLDRIGDKWSILVITILGESGTLRFNEINAVIGTISQKMLATTLKTLEADGLISRKIYPQVPPRVEYTLTERGESLLPAMAGLVTWALENMPAIKASREEYSGRKELV
jgi:DNA-binding HxlR family transcriptional regulator